MANETIYSSFKNWVEKQPEATAISQDGTTVSFRQLDRYANAILAKFINERHAFVGIVMQHGFMQIAAMLAVLKSGAAYVPAEPTLPSDRIRYMMENAGVKLVIDDNFCQNIIPTTKEFEDKSTPNSVAYVLYTSGTSGRPKGVVIENHSVVNYAKAFEKEMKIGYGDVMLQYSICSFDIFVEEVFATLLNGGTLAIPTKEIHEGGIEVLMDFCTRHKVSILDGFPYLIADINHRPELLPKSVNLIISGGDVVRENYISNLCDKGIRIYNTYGPSETTVCSNYYRIDNITALEDGTYPVGKAVDGAEVRILNEKMEELPKGQIGEICIFGEGVGRGYLGNPPEQANFITMADGTRFYRSGDMGYCLSDGNIVFLNRRDDQVMILGRRVEPEEVENVLNEYPGIERGIVRAFKDESGLYYLVAYIVIKDRFSLAGLKKWMMSKLSDFMVPEYFVALPTIPLTERGKVDMTRLPVILKEGFYK
ncbi:MAG: amino acid adenylation domain-containing protein [Muribaculaceae bacterium]|nr:amino acid adenylation domain-containing protein [Muribaculaceae bacterium]